MIRKEDDRKFVLGFDETNNGYSLKSFNPHYEPCLIMTGYLAQDVEMKNYCHCENEVKGRLFNGNKNIEEALIRGRAYIRDNPYFLYTLIPQRLQKSTPISILKAEAVALLAINFFIHYDLQQSNTRILMDEMDGKEHSKQVSQVLELWLKKAKINISQRHMKSAANHVLAVRKADMVGYYLAAIHLLGDHPNYPYKNHKVGFKSLERSLVEFLEQEDEEEYYQWAR